MPELRATGSERLERCLLLASRVSVRGFKFEVLPVDSQLLRPQCMDKFAAPVDCGRNLEANR